jgi:hypothetical protein
MTEALYIAAQQDKEYAVAQYLRAQLEAHDLTLVHLQQQFQSPSQPLPSLEVEQHPLNTYDTLLYDSNADYSTTGSQHSTQVSQTLTHAAAMV